MSEPLRLLDSVELAERWNVPTSWIREQTRAGHIPHIKLGRYVRYRAETVDAWLSEQEAGRSGVAEASAAGVDVTLLFAPEGPRLDPCFGVRRSSSRLLGSRGRRVGAYTLARRLLRAEEVVAVQATLENDLLERLVDRLRHAEQYADAARLMVEEPLALLDAAKEGKNDG